MMDKYGFGITSEYIAAHKKKYEERKRTNCKSREDGETFGSELIAGALSFDAIYGEEFYYKVVKQNGPS